MQEQHNCKKTNTEQKVFPITGLDIRAIGSKSLNNHCLFVRCFSQNQFHIFLELIADFLFVLSLLLKPILVFLECMQHPVFKFSSPSAWIGRMFAAPQ